MAYDILFYLFAFLTLGCALGVLLSRNPVTSAMFLVSTIVSMAGLFVLLEAYFLAAVQIIVYAGAVMVLFVFVIMLLDLKQEQARRRSLPGLAGGVVSVGVLAVIMANTFWKSNTGMSHLSANFPGDTESLGKLLFSNYVLPFEILSLLLLVAMVGAILLSKRDLN